MFNDTVYIFTRTGGAKAPVYKAHMLSGVHCEWAAERRAALGGAQGGETASAVIPLSAANGLDIAPGDMLGKTSDIAKAAVLTSVKLNGDGCMRHYEVKGAGV